MLNGNSKLAATTDGRASAETDPLGRSMLGVSPPLGAPILVAVDGSRASGAALRLAADLAGRDGSSIVPVLVESFALSTNARCIPADVLRKERVPEVSRLGRVRRQLCDVLDTDSWKLHVEFGPFGSVVAHLADSVEASLIVMGLSRHGAARRLLGSGAVARVLQSAQIPVFAVPATARELPHAALAAIDFSRASLRAARTARDLLSRPGTLRLVNVRRPRSETLPEIDAWEAIYGEGVSLKLEQLASELATDGVSTTAEILSGPLADTLLEAADQSNADLIACGTNSLNALEQLLLGDVPGQLLRRAECAVLVAPCPQPLATSEDEP